MNPIDIDADRCIVCSKCIDDCPNSYLFLENDEVHTGQKGCMECGHCYAICPQGAITMTNYDSIDEEVVLMSEINPETLLNAMKSRRTIRQFKPDPVEEEKIEKILEAGRYSPTGANRQAVSYTILGSKQREAEEICLSLFRKGKKLGSAFASYLKRIEIDDDFFFKGAPLVIVVASKSTVDGGLASSYMEIMAESLGLGVLYSGFFVACCKMSRKLKKLLELEKGYSVVTCMVIGYPDVKYQRIAPRKNLKVKKL
ncbi:nitroreductase family protein [Methanobrevibacter sp.]|uniref:nitroreductase family protein n=1 Tax=Methanobrevibacter sp. TaxID=66852 RepID=UPI003862E005